MRTAAVNQDTTKQDKEQKKDLVTFTDISRKASMSLRTNLATPVEEHINDHVIVNKSSVTEPKNTSVDSELENKSLLRHNEKSSEWRTL